MRKLLILMSLLPLTVMASPMDAGSHHCADKAHHEMQHRQADEIPAHLRELNLTEEQTAKIKTMMQSRRADYEAHKGQGRAIKKAIHELTMSDNYSETELEKLVDQSLVLHKQHMMERARFHHELFSVLTVEQQQQLKANMAKYKQNRQH